MRSARMYVLGWLGGCVVGTVLAVPALAEDADVAGQIEQLRGQITAQQERLADQQRQLLELEKRVFAKRLGAPSGNLAGLRGTGQPATGTGGPVYAQAQPQDQQQPVGQAPSEKSDRPQVAALSSVGGVLTPRGRLTVEPSFEYTNTQFNQLFFSGTEIVNAVFIGGLDATNARRNTVTAALNTRYGITDRLEANLRVPYLYRSDRESQGVNTSTLNRSVEGHDLGDIEFGIHYQINQPENGGPYYVANLRAKSDTGTGPFDVPFNTLGQQQQLPTGSGFWTVEPSVTLLYPVDPVVLYTNLGYGLSLGKDVNKQVGGNHFGEVDPGDVLRASFGMGFGINDRVSLSLGYEHNWVMATNSVVNGVKTSSEELQIGALLVGASYAFSPTVSGNFTVAIGATRDAPDVRLLFSVPISFDLFK